MAYWVELVFALLIIVVSLLLFGQSLFTLLLSTYHWNAHHDDAPPADIGSSDPPVTRITILVPAKDEESVIAETLWRIGRVDYPAELIEVAVICHESDHATIVMAGAALATTTLPNVGVVTYSGQHMSKPRGLNFGLSATSGDVVCVFDAEDDVSPGLLRQVDRHFRDPDVAIVQGGVQLMNFRDTWFSVHNCLEYFFWFRSRLHLHARVGAIPLGGNTVFIRRTDLERVGGWDEYALTEDADIGVRLSALGRRTVVFYDPSIVTREETPANIEALVRQRTRWQQGFIQVLGKGHWWQLATLQQRLLMMVTLSQPILDAVALTAIPICAAAMVLPLPLPVAMLSFAPLYGLGLQALLASIGTILFCREYGLSCGLLLPLRVFFTHPVYQLLIIVSGWRAVWREVLAQRNWEKTAHSGAHRLAQATRA